MPSTSIRNLGHRFAPAAGVSLRAGRSAAALLLGAFALPLASFAQESRVTIVGGLSDGTPPPAAPKPELPADFEIRDTVRHTLSGRNITVHRVKNPGLPDPAPTPEPPPPAPALPFATAPHSAPAAELDFGMLLLSATVVDHRATLLAWHHQGREYRAWSNLDFNDLSGFSGFRHGGRQVWILMSLGDVETAFTQDATFRIPSDLPVGKPAFRLIQGDAGDLRAYQDIAALHELYRTDGTRLRQTRLLREQRAREQQARLRAHPPVPEDFVLHYWKVQPGRASRTEGGAK